MYCLMLNFWSSFGVAQKSLNFCIHVAINFVRECSSSCVFSHWCTLSFQEKQGQNIEPAKFDIRRLCTQPFHSFV